MGNFLHRTTKQLLQSISPNSLADFPGNYISEPDLSAVAGVSPSYWIIIGDTVSEMSQSEKAAVDAAILTASRDSAISEIDQLESILRQFVKVVLGEINILRGEHGLSARTLTQLRTAIRNGLGS